MDLDWNASVTAIMVVLVVVIGMGFYIRYRYIIFQKTAKTGDKCRFIHEKRDRVGVIIHYNTDSVIIESEHYTFKRDRNEIWPVGL